MKKTWDNLVIDQTFETLIDTTGVVLDQYHLYQFQRITKRYPVLNFFIELLEYLEKELLVQWKIKQENGLNQMFEHQRCWYHAEVRSQGRFFELWNCFVAEYLKTSTVYPMVLENDSWKSIILIAMSDRKKIADIIANPNESSSNFQKFIHFYKSLYFIDPVNHVLSFLNIVELGLGFRPEIMEPVAQKIESEEIKNISPALRSLADSLCDRDHWEKADKILQDFWLLHNEDV
ncbi:MAG: hypothetical protein HOC24_15190 [Deltaproteobacteria bacterium]|nr:hypothetical protein [Deltaproteobacteria bacterium]